MTAKDLTDPIAEQVKHVRLTMLISEAIERLRLNSHLLTIEDQRKLKALVNGLDLETDK